MLEEIILEKLRELGTTENSENLPEAPETVPAFSPALLTPGPSIIAEIKYRSPSHGFFACRQDVCDLARQYAEAGAFAISVLTEEAFFAGKLEYLQQARRTLDQIDAAADSEAPFNSSLELIPNLNPPEQPLEPDRSRLAADQIPLLRKDFILSRRQIDEAKAYGASAFLLIVAGLEIASARAAHPVGLDRLIGYGQEAGLEALVEVHDPRELDTALEAGAKVIGVNNRNLKTFEVDIRTSFDLARRLEGETGLVLVAESGISEASQIEELHDAGFQAFLIGTAFMETENPGKALSRLRASLEMTRSG